jgi:hypothetical protein
MPFVVAISAAFSAARTQPRPVYAQLGRRYVEPGDHATDVHDDSALFQEEMELSRSS